MDRLLAFGRRHAAADLPGNAVQDLVAGLSPDAVAERRGLPLDAVTSIRSFYDQLDPVLRVCDGTSCRFGGGPELAARLREVGPVETVRCLGMCHDPPSLRIGDAVFSGAGERSVEAWMAAPQADALLRADARPAPRRCLAPAPIVLRDVLGGPPSDPAGDYALPGGDEIFAIVQAAGVRGRGGAAYPAAAKWKVARETPAPDRWVVANGDEGDPGSFVDRILMEEAPHAILAGMLAVARAIGASKGVVYVRNEYPRARLAMLDAVHEARRAGWLGAAFDVEIFTGAGSYVCGEETALLRSIEGLRGEPWTKPPYPAQVGLFGLPTVVQNVETLAALPWVVRHRQQLSTKVFCLAGAVAEPGMVEATIGIPLRTLLQDGGGGPAPGRRWKMALVGGPMGRVVPAADFDVPLSFEGLPGMGHGGIVVLDDRISARELAGHLFQFAAAESCGNCTPCRVGTGQLARVGDRATFDRLLDLLERGSLCGFGQGVPRPLRDLLAAFPEEMFPC